MTTLLCAKEFVHSEYGHSDFMLGPDSGPLHRRFGAATIYARCHILANKYTKGDGKADGTMPVADMLVEPWPADCHFTMYTSPAETRLLKGRDSYPGIRFDIACFDADFKDHGEPLMEDFANLVRKCSIIDEEPNIVYQTKRGARLLYLIEPMGNVDKFERHRQSLMMKLDRSFANNGYGYHVDCSAKDWTRLFRLPVGA